MDHVMTACRLGLNLEAALEGASSTLTPPLLEAWLAEERSRQAAQWEPRRAEQPRAAAAAYVAAADAGDLAEEGDEEEEEEEEEVARRSVAWRDVRTLLWRFGEWGRGWGEAAGWRPACLTVCTVLPCHP